MNGKVVLITGGTRGIGRAIARSFAGAGARLVLGYVSDQEAADRFGKELEEQKCDHLLLRTDVAREGEVATLFAKTAERFGRVDIVIANAGIEQIDNALADHPQGAIDRLIDVNVRGTLNTLQHAARQVSDGGRIIVVASTIALDPPPNAVAYAATKAAALPMVKSLARELGGRRINVNAILPGVVENAGIIAGMPQAQIDAMAGFCPLGRLCRPEDIGPVALFLASPGGAFINGQQIVVDGGSSL